jgi:hypothetical protein
MSDRHRICPVLNQICSLNQGNAQQKSRSGTKTMNLELDKLMTNKQDTIEHIEISGTTRCNLFTRNHT